MFDSREGPTGPQQLRRQDIRQDPARKPIAARATRHEANTQLATSMRPDIKAVAQTATAREATSTPGLGRLGNGAGQDRGEA